MVGQRNPIKVLHVLASMNRGGAETFIMNVFRNIDRSKFLFDFLLNYLNSDYEGEILELGGKVFNIPPRNKGVLSYNKNLNIFFKKHSCEYKIVHQHVSSLSSIEPLIFAKKYNVPIRVIHSHNTKQGGSPIHLILHHFNKLKIPFIANRYLACSDLAKNWLYNNTFVKNNATIINNGIDSDAFKFNEQIRLLLRKLYGLEEKLVFGHVGRFNKVKNHIFLIDVFYQFFSKYNNNSHLILVGTGSLLENIREYVQKLNIQDKVTFFGLRDDIPKLLQLMDIFIYPSLYEGLPVSLVEAQASGLMVYCSKNISEQVKITERLCFLDLKLKPEEWASIIHKDYETCDRNEINTKNITKYFSIKSVVSQLENSVYFI